MLTVDVRLALTPVKADKTAFEVLLNSPMSDVLKQ
jgi:hypothetical protein